jgi:hypothetical protein
MIVYRDQRSRADPHHLLADLRAVTTRSQQVPPHEIVRDTLIAAGTLESAVLDALFPEADGVHPLAGLFRAASTSSGHALWHTWHNRAEGARLWWNRLARQLQTIDDGQLPREVETTVPEGYAQYAVYPEMYLEAARQCHNELGPNDAVCLGLRSIGTSLSGAVVAGLIELGWSVRSAAIRPRGHPFSRHPVLTPSLLALLKPREGTHYLLVDEGPGISGSSIAGTAAFLREWGIPDNRILLFPSWRTDGSQLHSDQARESWPRYHQFVASFEDVWLQPDRLSQVFPGVLQDISAGAWRPHVYSDQAEWPAVQPQHERRKYLVFPERAVGTPKLLSFVGLGKHAGPKVCRARRLAQAGFTPEPESLAHGFLLRPFIPGNPVRTAGIGRDLVERVATYLAHLSLEYVTEPTVSDGCLRQMIEVNVAEGLGPSWAERIPVGAGHGGWCERVVALDGRMLAQEWIQTPTAYLKVDAWDHHDDHFFPGCQDVAWDVTSAATELQLGEHSRAALIERYRQLSGDQTISRRIPFFTLAYLSFRMGYTAMAVSALGNSPDGIRFATENRRYIRLLQQELSGAPAIR